MPARTPSLNGQLGVSVTPKNLNLAVADRTLGLPAGLVQAWVGQGLLRPVWFVDHGQIVRGVRVNEARHLVDQCRARRVQLIRARNCK